MSTFDADRPRLVTEVPGPASRSLAARLARVESPNVTFISDDWPVFLDAGAGATLIDADGNRLLDMTACFAVAALGHGPTPATEAGVLQLARLAHAMGDVHPAAAKVELLERLASIAPFPNARTILGCNGSDAVEAALKTAKLTTGRPGVIAFTGGYHGLSYGALAGTNWPMFRDPFAEQLPAWSHVARYPSSPSPHQGEGRGEGESAVTANTQTAIADVEQILDGPKGSSIGAIIVEPILGRGGHVIPPDGFLPALRRIADERGLLLIFDEIYTGLGRTGKLWACEHVGVAPDLLLVGKALASGFPISACIGNERAMAGWPASAGEAIHTFTFLGHPVGCAMACAAVDEIVGRNLPARSAELGGQLLAELSHRLVGRAKVAEVRGRGLLIGIELSEASRPVLGPGLGVAVMKECLRRGLLVLTGGQSGNVIGLTPPLTVTRGQLQAAADILVDSIGCVTESS